MPVSSLTTWDHKISGSLLFDYLSVTSQTASIKSPECGEYTSSNSANTKLMGFASPHQLIGLTVRDLDFSRSRQGSIWAANIQRMDYVCQKEKRVVDETHEYLNEACILSYTITTKLPLIGIRGRVFGIVTLNQE
jgi:hypothetical protein